LLPQHVINLHQHVVINLPQLLQDSTLDLKTLFSQPNKDQDHSLSLLLNQLDHKLKLEPKTSLSQINTPSLIKLKLVKHNQEDRTPLKNN
jgi:hypothetical protein